MGERLSLRSCDLDVLNPFYIQIDEQGLVLAHGRTLPAVFGGSELVGQPLEALFFLVRPRNKGVAGIIDGTQMVKLKTRPPDGIASSTLTGSAVPLGSEGTDERQALLMMTPGIEIQRLVDKFDIKQKDLSPADSSADLLYLVQAQKQLLVDAIANAERLEKARNKAEAMASADPMTGLPNRRGLAQRFDRVMHMGSGCGLLHIDLDRFKAINDTYGHAAGDAVILHVSEILELRCRDALFAARIGGDEFVVLAQGEGAGTALSELTAHIRLATTKPMDWNGLPLKFGASFGLAEAKAGEETSLDVLLHQSDLALFEAKRSGRGALRVFDPALMQHQQKLRTDALEIPGALARSEFLPHYQAQINVETGRIIGVEVLARWQHETRGLIPPKAFLEAADYANALEDVDSQVRRKALSDFAEWRRHGIDLPRISFNISVEALLDPDVGHDLAWRATELGVPLECITLEVLESVFFDEGSDALVRRAQYLSDKGFRLALDDFGTGHASLSSLIRLPVDEIKIDRSFADGVADNPQLRTLTETLCRMGQNLGIDVLAEGIERVEDLEVMREFGVGVVQGFLFSRPVSGEALCKVLTHGFPARQNAPGDAGQCVRE